MNKISNQWTPKKIVKILHNNGYRFERNTQGSHQIYSNGVNNISIPYNRLNPMMMKRIIKENNLKI